MIPKIIHYCWLSNDPMPAQLVECINSWKKVLPDYKIKLWNTSNFDIHCCKWVEDAYAQKKWAFACDYIRVYALYHEGGVYFDSDVFVKKTIDSCLKYRFFSAVEAYQEQIDDLLSRQVVDVEGQRLKDEPVIGVQIQAAVMGAEAKHPFLKDCLDYYEHHSFIDMGGNDSEIISPVIFAKIAEKYGYRYIDKEQDLKEEMHLFPSCMFAPNMDVATSKALAIHCCAGSWRWLSNDPWKHKMQVLKEYIKNVLFRLHLRGNEFRNRIK